MVEIGCGVKSRLIQKVGYIKKKVMSRAHLPQVCHFIVKRRLFQSENSIIWVWVMTPLSGL